MRPAVLFAAALAAVTAAAAENTPAVFAGLPQGKACVAWKARKRILMLWRTEAIGVSCAVKVRALDEVGGRSVHVSFPIASLRSGEPLRDFQVQGCLGAVRFPEIEFVSRPYARDEWTALRAGRIRELEGSLRISGVAYALKLPFSLLGSGAQAEAQGAVMTSLAVFGVQAPKGLGAFEMKVEDAVELDYRVPLSSL